jgi:hypothetical protein
MSKQGSRWGDGDLRYGIKRERDIGDTVEVEVEVE